MSNILDKLAAAAAAAAPPSGGQGGPPPGQGDPAMGDPSMAPMPDPIEQDNMRLTSILQNLQLRAEVVQAQAELEELTKQIQQSNAKPPMDPDRPAPRAGSIPDLAHASGLTELLRRTPKGRSQQEVGAETKARPKAIARDTQRGVPTTPGRADADALKAAPMQYQGS